MILSCVLLSLAMVSPTHPNTWASVLWIIPHSFLFPHTLLVIGLDLTTLNLKVFFCSSLFLIAIIVSLFINLELQCFSLFMNKHFHIIFQNMIFVSVCYFIMWFYLMKNFLYFCLFSIFFFFFSFYNWYFYENYL